MSEIVVTDIIAVVFDFDETLMPDSTTSLLKAHSVNSDEFWAASNGLLSKDYDQPTAYLKLLLEDVGESKPLGRLTNRALADFGAGLDGEFFYGLPEFFHDLRAQVESQFKNIRIEYYIISGGLQAIMQGNSIVQKYFSGVYGCQLGEDEETGLVSHIKRSITFTEKTRYLFEINKGIPQVESEVDPFLVNKDIPPTRRRIPFANIIYVGDGLTDIPCFSLVQHFGGTGFGVFDPASSSKTKRALEEFLLPRRVVGMYAPDYRSESVLGALLRMAVTTRAAQIQLEREMAQRAQGG